MKEPSSWKDPRTFVSLAVILLFGVAFLRHQNNALLIGALIGAFSTAVGYWLGSSKGSADKTRELVSLAHGELESSEPKPVKIVNTPGRPVPTRETTEAGPPPPSEDAPALDTEPKADAYPWEANREQ
jgi:hypothetical protein